MSAVAWAALDFGPLWAVVAGVTPPASSSTLASSGELAAIRSRDPGAWRALFDREMPPIYRYVLGRVGSSDAAEEITSHVFEEAWKHAERLEDRGVPARAWLFGIARNVVNDHRRRWVQKPPELDIADFQALAARDEISHELLDLAQAVRSLPRNYAEVVMLRFVHGLSLEETAHALITSVDSVKGRQARALAMLRERLADERATGREVRRSTAGR